MKHVNRANLMRLIGKLRERPTALLTLGAVLVFCVTYLFSRHQDRKIITYQNSVSEFSTGRTVTRNNDLYKRKDKIYLNRVEELEDKLETVTGKLEEYAQALQKKRSEEESKEPANGASARPPLPGMSATTNPALALPSVTPSPRNFPTISLTEEPSPRGVAKKKSQRRRRKGPDIISFPVAKKSHPRDLGVKLPTGSFVKGKLLTGIEAPEGKTLPVLMQADYAFIGPNKSKVDLSGCFMIAKSTGNLSIERVEMQTTKISCVARSGRTFERNLNGYIADGKDNSFAVMGSVNSKRDRVASMAFLSSVVEGIGNAVSQAQTTTSTNSNGQSTTKITGSQAKLLAASGASSAASSITSWYLKHAEGLLPTINVGSGQEVWVVVQESVSLPNWYFKAHKSQSGQLSFLSNILK